MQQEILKRYLDRLPEGVRPDYERTARKFLEWLGDSPLDAAAVSKWTAKRRRERYSDGTIFQEWSILRRLYKVNNIPWDFARGESPTVREQEVWAPALDPDDIRSMIRVCLGAEPHKGRVPPSIQHRVFLALATVYGIRRGEMASITPQDLDPKKGLLFIETLKSGRQRHHIIPDAIMPHLVEWGFSRKVSLSFLSSIMGDLKAMVGFTGRDAREVGWHAIRRSLDYELIEAGLTEATVSVFLRWKRPTTNMAMRYHNTPVVGTKGRSGELSLDDRRVDERVFAVHPFLPAWG